MMLQSSDRMHAVSLKIVSTVTHQILIGNSADIMLANATDGVNKVKI